MIGFRRRTRIVNFDRLSNDIVFSTKPKVFRPIHLETNNVSAFQGNSLPGRAKLAGLAALAHALSLQAPVRSPSCVSEKHVRNSRRKDNGWALFDRSYWPGDSFADHLTFAPRHGHLALLILKRAFEAVSPDTIAAFVRAVPSGSAARRAWFLYETFTG